MNQNKKWLKKSAVLCLLLVAALLNTAFTGLEILADSPADDSPETTMTESAQPEADAPLQNTTTKKPYTKEEKALLSKLNGTWVGTFKRVISVVKKGEKIDRKYVNDGVVMNFVYNGGTPNIYLTIDSSTGNYVLPRSWSLKDGSFIFTVNDAPNQGVATLKLVEGKTNQLTGKYRYKGQEMEMTMQRTSTQPTDFAETPQFLFEGEGDDVWYERLRMHGDYSSEGNDVSYQYELGVNAKNKSINTRYKVLQTVRGKTDVQAMIALLNLVCDYFPHDGASGMPEKLDALSCIAYAEDNSGIECRGLSAILAEMCRMAGIPAKSVMCIPSKDPCDDCHIVVQAYSQSLGQWVMLDPTYRVVLRDEDGRYMNLETMREKLVNDEPMIANDNAGRNGAIFYMEHYRAYMAKNMFRFSSLTTFGFDAANRSGNRENMLLPLDYVIPFLPYRTERLTTYADGFWAAPKGMEKATPFVAPENKKGATSTTK